MGPMKGFLTMFVMKAAKLSTYSSYVFIFRNIDIHRFFLNSVLFGVNVLFSWLISFSVPDCFSR